MIQEMWKLYITENPTNHPGERKAKRLAFYAGAMFMRDHMDNVGRIRDAIENNGATPSIVMVVNNDES